MGGIVLVFLNKKSRSISRILYPLRPLSFIYVFCYQKTLAAYPSTLYVPHSSVDLHGIAPHRVYLISLQLNLYILSVALFLTSRPMAVNHYAALWCSDFPLVAKANSDKAICFAAKIHKLLINSLFFISL